jgi:hypothetical protein
MQQLHVGNRAILAGSVVLQGCGSGPGYIDFPYCETHLSSVQSNYGKDELRFSCVPGTNSSQFDRMKADVLNGTTLVELDTQADIPMDRSEVETQGGSDLVFQPLQWDREKWHELRIASPSVGYVEPRSDSNYAFTCLVIFDSWLTVASVYVAGQNEAVLNNGFTVTFSEPVSQPSAGDVTVDQGGNGRDCVPVGVSQDAQRTWNFACQDIDWSQSLQVIISGDLTGVGGTGVKDLHGNPGISVMVTLPADYKYQTRWAYGFGAPGGAN